MILLFLSALSCSPIVNERSKMMSTRTINASHQLKQICSGAFARKNQLLRADPRSGQYDVPYIFGSSR